MRKKMSIKKYLYLFAALICSYHVLVIGYLYQTNVWTLVAYYTTPPWIAKEGYLELPPILKGDEISYSILKRYKSNEINELVKSNKLGIAAILTAEDMSPFDKEEAIKRNINIANLALAGGADINECFNGHNMEQFIKKFSEFTQLKKSFLESSGYIGKDCGNGS